MGIYYVLYVAIMLYAFVCRKVAVKRINTAVVDYKKKNTIISCGIFLMVYLLLGLRHPYMGYDLGYDNTTGYLANFDRISAEDWGLILKGVQVQHYEYGYIVLNKLIGTFSTSWQVFVACMAFLSLLPIHIFINKESENALMSWIVYLGLPIFLIVYSGIRQAVAIGICCVSFHFIKERKIIPFVLIVVLAGLMHKSACLFALAYPAYWIPIKKKVRVVTLCALVGIFVFRSQLLTLISTLVDRYVEIDDNGSVSFFVLLTMIYIFCMLFSDGSEESEGLLNIYFLACVCQTFSAVNNIIGRTGYYFQPILLVLLPRIVNSVQGRNTRLLFKASISAGFIAFGLFSIWSTDWARAVPYLFFWQN